MTKYYRVRSQEQWDWLMEHLELEYPFSSTTFLTDSIFMDLKDDQQLVPKISIKSSNINKIIEVSKLMEDEKMENEDYVTIKGEDVEKLMNEQGDSLFFMSDKQHFTYSFIEGFNCSEVNIPKFLLYPKVHMSVAEKKEFDDLRGFSSLYMALDTIMQCPSMEWFQRLHGDETELDSKSEKEFTRAFFNPSLIEVIPDKKWNVKVPASDYKEYYQKSSTEKIGTISFVEKHTLKQNNMQFTAEELKRYGLDNDIFEKDEVKE